MRSLLCGGNVFFSLFDLKTHPVTEAGLFYDTCEFHYIETDSNNLNELLKLGDIFVFEPTGAYSWVWHNKKSRDGYTNKIDNIWLFITNEKMNLGKLARFDAIKKSPLFMG